MNYIEDVAICEFKNCKLYLENPIALPCGYTVCKQHLEIFTYDEKFKCLVCSGKHQVPSKNDGGFKVNNQIMKFLYLYPSNRSAAKMSYEKLICFIDDYEKISDETFINVYFDDLRNGIDLHRMLLIKEIKKWHCKKNERDEKLIECEKNYQRIVDELEQITGQYNKLVKVEKTNFEQLKQNEIIKWKSDLRCPKIKRLTVERLTKAIIEKLNEIEFILNKLKFDVFMGIKFEFKPHYNEFFGDLIRKYLLPPEVKENSFAQTLQSFCGHKYWINCIMQYKNKLISGSLDNTIKIWNINTGECLKTINNHTKSVNYLQLIDDNKFASCSNDNFIYVWDTEKFECLNEVKIMESVPITMCMVKGELACGLESGKIIFFKFEKKNMEKFDERIADTNSLIKFFKYSFVLKTLVIGFHDAKITLMFKNKKFRELSKNEVDHTLISMSLTKDQKQLLSLLSNNQVNVWDLKSCQLMKSFNLEFNVNILKSISEELIVLGQDKNIILYCMRKLGPNGVVKSIKNAHDEVITDFILDKNGNLLSASGDKTIKSWSFLKNKNDPNELSQKAKYQNKSN